MASNHLRYPSAGFNLPQSRGRQLLFGLAPMLALYVLYSLVRFVVKDRGPAEGLQNAQELLHIEQRLGLNWESTIQTFALAHEWLVIGSNWYYVAGFLPVVILTAAIATVRAHQAFLWWRTRFAFTLVLALFGFALYPLAPPRMLPGMVDTLMVYGPQYYGDTHGSSMFNLYGRIPSMVNVYAAMPSMHVAWSIVAGALVICSFRGHWWAKPVGIAHPILMSIAVVATANHYLLDVVLGVAALVGAIAILEVGERVREYRWHERTNKRKRFLYAND
jgi:hypothetical protein